MEENDPAPPPKKDISFPQYKKYLWLGGRGEVYTIENKDAKTDYQELVRVGDQKWDMVKITVGIISFLFEIHIHYFLYIQGIFQSHLKKKLPPPKVPIPTQNPNLT